MEERRPIAEQRDALRCGAQREPRDQRLTREIDAGRVGLERRAVTQC
jgi:hypothetical protein